MGVQVTERGRVTVANPADEVLVGEVDGHRISARRYGRRRTPPNPNAPESPRVSNLLTDIKGY